MKVKIARIYAQVGPHLPLDKHFAIGNFINDVLADREIVVRGDGSPIRSYLYVADTVIWLWAMLIRGRPGQAWNVGGSQGISIADLAERVKNILGSNKGVRVMRMIDPDADVEQYVPNVNKAMKELNLTESITLDEAIKRTATWYKGARK